VASNQILEFKRVINAPAAEVYRAFTHLMALCEWMCEELTSTVVQLSISERKGRATLKLVHGGVGSGKAWAKMTQQLAGALESARCMG
jgi:uncharacterized protein YndB with AHSA1/START domain